METISSGLRIAGSALYSAGQAASSAASSAASWLGRNIKWLTSSTKPAASMTAAGGGKPILSRWIKSWTTSSNSPDSTDSSITTSVTAQSTPPQTSFKEFACHEAVARAIEQHPPGDMDQEAEKNLNLAITYFNMSTKPGILSGLRADFKNKAVSHTKAAIEKCSQETKQKITTTLKNLNMEYDAFQNQAYSMPTAVETRVNESGEIVQQEVPPDAQEILQSLKAELSKTAQAAFPPKEAKESSASLQTSQPSWQPKQALAKCAALRNQIQSTTFTSPTYLTWAESALQEATRLYSSGNFSLGNNQYNYANNLVNGKEYAKLRK